MTTLNSCFRFIFLLWISAQFLACHEPPNPQKIIDETIAISGGDAYENSFIEFDFRDAHYKVQKNMDNYKMMRTFKGENSVITDVMSKELFKRSINHKNVNVPDSMINKYRNSINSVFYFALLPYGLNDEAVMKKYLDQVELEGNDYHKIQISFQEEGGGEDFEDVYIYWINSETKKIDFLAYSFLVDGGGLRFRKAYNERYVNGIRFVDYHNYKADPKEIQLTDMAREYEAGKLKEVSRIELKNIKVKIPNS